MFVNDTMIVNEENAIKRYREKYSQLIANYKNLRNESIRGVGFPPDSYMKESLDDLGKYPFINHVRLYACQKLLPNDIYTLYLRGVVVFCFNKYKPDYFYFWTVSQMNLARVGFNVQF